jgi:hypothetical protein
VPKSERHRLKLLVRLIDFSHQPPRQKMAYYRVPDRAGYKKIRWISSSNLEILKIFQKKRFHLDAINQKSKGSVLCRGESIDKTQR